MTLPKPGVPLWGRVAFALGIALLLIPAIAGADFGVEATVDRNVVTLGGTLRLTITVTGASDVERPDLSGLEGFEVVGTSSSQNISMVNLKVTRSLSLIYTLAALEEGNFTLGPFTVRAGDNIGETEAIRVTVAAAAGGVAPGGQPTRTADETGGKTAAFATSDVDKSRAYVGEQVTYTLKFAYRLRMLQGMEFIPPEHTGFWYEDLGDAGPVIETIGGRQYYVVTKKLAFFPISSGTHTIGESGIRYVAETSDPFARDPFSIFGRDPFGRLRGQEGVAMADPVAIQVQPLPAVGRPADFSGAVGRFDVTARATRNEVKVDESITLVVRVSGRGNLKSVGDLPTPEIPGFRVFAPKSRQTISADRGVIGGEKRFEFVLVAQERGKFTIDGVGFTYFDTESERYTTARAAPITVTVLPGDAVVASSGESAPGIDLSSTDIRHIRRLGRLGDDLRLVRGSQAFVVWVLPVVMGVAGALLKVHRRRQAACVRVSARKAFREVMSGVRQARAVLKKGDEREETAAILARAITRYIAVRSDCRESNVDVEYIRSLGDVSGETRRRLMSLLTALDQVRFAPAGLKESDMENLISEAERILAQVNEEWAR